MSRSFLRIRQPAITRLNPHAGNRRFILPKRLIGAAPVPDVLTGLVTQNDVNTNGRTDDLPYDNILDVVATPFNAPTVAAGDGGYDQMVFNGVDQICQLDASANGFLSGGDFTFGCRASGVGVVEMGVYAFSGGAGQASLHLPLNVSGVTLAFVRNDAGQNIQAQSTGTVVNDGVEHTLVCRFIDATKTSEIWIDGVLINSGNNNAVTPPITTTAHTWAAFIDPTPIIAFAGQMAWSAGWDRDLTDEQMEYLFAVPNPFGRTA